VKVVRFLAKDGDAKQLIDFEQLALRECAETHRQLQQLLKNAGVAVTPLMLVQVPDGKVAQHKAAAYLTGALKFSPDSVRVHTADEPDPDLIALANDPKVEVLIFKMAVAMGFDAPRAFTLAALRGARDPNFGVQVIGRIVRVHAGLQGKSGLPEALNYGYVFLANAESQEGLMAAGDQINTLRTQAPELGTSLVFTVSGSRSQVQVVASGEPMALMLEASGAISTSRCESLDDSVDSDDAVAVRAQVDSWRPAAEGLFGAALGADAASVGPTAATSSGALARAALAAAPGMRVYKRRDGVPSTLRTESLPKPSADYELRLAVHVDFNAKVLGDRIRTRTTLNRREADLFRADHTHEDERDISASLSVQAVADRANDLLHAIAETHEREFRQRLLECFAKAIKNSDAPLPDQNELEDQLDLVLVRNPHLLREAYRSLRLTEVRVATVNLQSELVSEQALTPSQRNAYGVYPADLNEDERAVAQLLDRDKRVRWWHRNPPQKADSVGLYSWDEGAGFFPDFVLAVEGRTRLDEIALLEVKGHQLWRFDKEPEKSDAVHPDYGAVFMVGRKRGEKDFVVLKRQDAELKDNGRFSLERLLW
jgi:hypothetical protein